MTKNEQNCGDTKTCPACGGTWPSDRRTCLACGANLDTVSAQPAAEPQGQEPLDWAWLDAMADGEAPPEMPQPPGDQEKPGCLGRIFLA